MKLRISIIAFQISKDQNKYLMEFQISLQQTKILCDFTFSRNIFQFSGYTEFPSLSLSRPVQLLRFVTVCDIGNFCESPLKAEIHKVNNLHSFASIGELF